MTQQKTIYALKNTVKNYAWGTKGILCSRFGYENSDDQPQAEVWIGAHDSAPSQAVSISASGEALTLGLDALIATDPEKFLGAEVVKNFGTKLPFLLKILSAETPLSLQAHPNKLQAEAGFSRENAAGVALDDPKRSYRDANHKPELMYALDGFEAMCGFREQKDITALLEAYGVVSLIELDGWSIQELFCYLLNVPHSLKTQMIYAAISYAKQVGADDLTARTIGRLYAEYPDDIGVLSPLLLRCFQLESGDAIYLDAGTIHAYTHGTGIEIMANSDNVLRAGLTPKHIDMPELLQVANFTSAMPTVIRKGDVKVESDEHCIHGDYTVGVPDFAFEILRIHGPEYREAYTGITDDFCTILLCVDGECVVQLDGENNELVLPAGSACFIPAYCKKYMLFGDAMLAKASVNL